MILDFRNYKMEEGHSSPNEIIIYPGMQIEVRRRSNTVTFNMLGQASQFPTTINLANDTEAKQMMKDIDIFLQYKTNELPEYKL